MLMGSTISMSIWVRWERGRRGAANIVPTIAHVEPRLTFHRSIVVCRKRPTTVDRFRGAHVRCAKIRDLIVINQQLMRSRKPMADSQQKGADRRT